MVEKAAGQARSGLAGAAALVTGASSGIGLETARRLAREGARVFMVARGRERLAAAADSAGGTAMVCDVSDPTDVERLAVAVGERLDGSAPDVVVSAAGVFGLARMHAMELDLFDRHLSVNLRAPFLLVRAFLPSMLERGSGHLVSIGSVAGRVAFPENGAYSASKFGLRGLHAVLDVELRGTGVRSTLVEPAATDTPLWAGIDRDRHPGLPPPEAMLRPEAVARAVLFAVTASAEVDVRNIILDRT